MLFTIKKAGSEETDYPKNHIIFKTYALFNYINIDLFAHLLEARADTLLLVAIARML